MEQKEQLYDKKQKRRLVLKIMSLITVSSLLFLSFTQLVMWFYNTGMDAAGAGIAERLVASAQVSVFALFFGFLILWFFIIYLILRPLFLYLEKGVGYEKARRVTIRLPWINITLLILMWIIGVFAYFIPRNWVSEAGFPPIWVFLTKVSTGTMGAIYANFFINNVLMKIKKELNITEIQDRENDKFIRNKNSIAIAGIVFFAFAHLGMIIHYFSEKSPDATRYFSYNAGLIAVGIFILLAGLGLMWLSKREQLYQTNFLKEKLRQFSQGQVDLSKRIVIINFDEIGELGAEFNRILSVLNQDFNSIHRVGLSIRDSSQQVSSASGDLATQTEEQASGSEEISVTMEEFSKQMDEMREQIDRQNQVLEKSSGYYFRLIESLKAVIEETQSLRAAMEENLQSAETGVETVKQSMESTQASTARVKSITETIRGAEEETGHIDDILMSIEDIADRTNMLSMNASIEAAHAGEAGTGFMIVAEEIRELANTTSQAVRNISDLIGNIKQSVRESVGIAEAGQTQADESNKLATRSEALLRGIIEKIQGNVHSIQSIANTMNDQQQLIQSTTEESTKLQEITESIVSYIKTQSRNAEQIKQSLSALSQSYEENVKSSERMASLSDELKSSGDQLGEVLDQFHVEEDNK